MLTIFYQARCIGSTAAVRHAGRRPTQAGTHAVSSKHRQTDPAALTQIKAPVVAAATVREDAAKRRDPTEL
jgi:hypothetical protein